MKLPGEKFSALLERLDAAVSDDLNTAVALTVVEEIAAMKKVIEAGLFTTLVQSGWVLAARGITSMEEVDRVASARC